MVKAAQFSFLPLLHFFLLNGYFPVSKKVLKPLSGPGLSVYICVFMQNTPKEKQETFDFVTTLQAQGPTHGHFMGGIHWKRPTELENKRQPRAG